MDSRDIFLFNHMELVVDNLAIANMRTGALGNWDVHPIPFTQEVLDQMVIKYNLTQVEARALVTRHNVRAQFAANYHFSKHEGTSNVVALPLFARSEEITNQANDEGLRGF